MIKVVAKSVLKDGAKEKVLEMLDEMIEKTREEEGNIKYELFQNLKEPNVITFIEEWKDMDAFNSHTQAEHYKRIMPKVRELRTDESTVDLYEKIK